MLNSVFQAALEEDCPWGDVTTSNLIPTDARMTVSVTARTAGVASAVDVIHEGFAGCAVELQVGNGDKFEAGQVLATASGPAPTILTAERVTLNLLQHACAVATHTGRFVEAVEGTGATIIDTRKTTPGLRRLEKDAVRHGGGRNHRHGLSDAVLVKDNHIAVLGGIAKLPVITPLLPHTTHIEIEVDSTDQIEDALRAGAQTILCDNFSPAQLTEAVRIIGGRATVEASGGVTLDTVRAIALTGVQLIAVGALTHGPPAIDIGLDVE